MRNTKNVIAGVIGILVVGGIVWYALPGRAPQPGSEPPTDDTKIPAQSDNKNDMHRIIIKTNYGDIVFHTFDVDAPKTVENFIALANKGFYNNLTFHRIISGFMIQGGDPSGNGTGGPGYEFADELNPATESYKNGYKRGVVAMANRGPNTNGSQFFIMHQDYQLDHNYTIFGHVVTGQEVVDKIAAVRIGPNDRSLEPVIMEQVTVEVIP